MKLKGGSVKLKKERGQTMAEYALIIGLAVVLIIAAYKIFGTSVKTALGLSAAKIVTEAGK
jgi:Flp pilus assembly pilin Flp